MKWFRKQPVTIRAAVIGAVIAAASPFLIWVLTAILSSDSHLEIVDVGIVESSIFPKIDVKLRNTGAQTAFVKQANFNVHRIWELFPIEVLTASVDASQDYIVDLNTSGAPYRLSKPISQALKPNEVDRFTFSLHNERAKEFDRDYVYLLTVELVYDADNKSVITQQMMFMTDINGTYKCGEDEPTKCNEELSHNSKVLSELSQINALKSETLKDFLSRKGGPKKPPAEIRRSPTTSPTPTERGSSKLRHFSPIFGRTSYAELIARSVRIQATRRARATFTKEPLINIQRISCKGGLLSEDGWILTAGHCVDGAEEVKAILANDSERNAEIMVVEGDVDLALLKISLSSDDVREILKKGQEEALKTYRSDVDRSRDSFFYVQDPLKLLPHPEDGRRKPIGRSSRR